MLRLLARAGLLLTTLSAPLAACSTVTSPGHVDAALLQYCSDPIMSKDYSTDNAKADDFVSLAQAYVACRARHKALVDAEKTRGVK